MCTAVAFVLKQGLKSNQSPHFLVRGQSGRGEEGAAGPPTEGGQKALVTSSRQSELSVGGSMG